jgi:hypothetical protein
MLIILRVRLELCNFVCIVFVQGGSNMTGTDLCVNKSQFVPVIFEPPCNFCVMYCFECMCYFVFFVYCVL